MRRRTNPEAVEKLAAALDAGVTSVGDPEVDRAIAAARALAPSVRPREAFRATLEQRILHDFDNARGASAGGPSEQIDTAEVPVHTRDVLDPALGYVTLSDLEPIDTDRARQVVGRLSEIAARPREQS